MAAPVVSIQNVSKRFAKAQILRDVSFDVLAGQVIALAGENGAGKTTLLKCLLDFCTADKGAIHIGGVPSNRSASRRMLAFLPERFTPPWFLTGREFVHAAMQMSGSTWNDHDVLATLDDLDLAPSSLDKPVRAFSKGMTQKLGLAACFLTGKQLFVLDEPMSGLDPSARVRVKHRISRLKDDGKAVLFTSHSLADIEEICDHMVVLHKGAVAFAGTPGNLLERQAETSLERAFLKCIESSPHD